MANWTEERVALALGLSGGLVFLVGAFVTLLTGSVDLVTGRLTGALDLWSDALLLSVLGGLAMLFSYLGHSTWRDRPFSAALVLIVVALLAAAVLGPGTVVFTLIGAMLVGVAGVLYLIDPMTRAVHYVATG
ncbi:MAG: hypothetical protein L3K09_04815 [Thermoplasmata archaeon]|nr:hypothetical protein [Thermoplasmata archaeon]